MLGKNGFDLNTDHFVSVWCRPVERRDERKRTLKRTAEDRNGCQKLLRVGSHTPDSQQITGVVVVVVLGHTFMVQEDTESQCSNQLTNVQLEIGH